MNLKSFIIGPVVVAGSLLAFGSLARANSGGLFEEEWLMPGQSLTYGCQYAATMQPDGNLVLRDATLAPNWSGPPYWSSGTTGAGYARMHDDGNFDIAGWSDNVVWETKTAGNVRAHLELTSVGQLVVEKYLSVVGLWWSGTVRQTATYGSCSGITVGTFMIKQGVDFAGGDYNHFALSTPQASWCAYACNADSWCRSFTYVPPGIQGAQAQCWLKNGTIKQRVDSRMTSGARSYG